MNRGRVLHENGKAITDLRSPSKLARFERSIPCFNRRWAHTFAILLLIAFAVHIHTQPPTKEELSTPKTTISVNITAKYDNITLEFVHITKTAGSAIEKAAGNVGIQWGACHWKYIDSFGPGCRHGKSHRKSVHRPYKPNQQKEFMGMGKEPWHNPTYWYEHNYFEGKALFCVVRNPYDRIVSEYYSKYGGYRGINDKNDPNTLNDWIESNLHGMQTKEYKGSHKLPQHLYIWNKKGERVIAEDHVLRYETLNEDFDTLMEQYNLTAVKLPDGDNIHERANARNRTISRLTVDNLSNITIALINEVYREDFRRLNYSMI